MGSSLPIMVTKRAGQIECKRVVNWSAVFQLVFQLKIKLDINVINQQFTKRIQITPAHQTKHQQSPPSAGFVASGVWGLGFLACCLPSLLKTDPERGMT
jgi:hypothetical protein